ncbi:class I SAM-dependent RNA methyltransferase [Rhodoligotrophos ferricapiens]|uniref:class I SAM-dependent RNA methyltransferase n=1 Tax=Rhodoligotrophos ferricapiens TaxID=3069264 RepID=UPI00315C9B17
MIEPVEKNQPAARRTVEIKSMGRRGEGIASGDGGPLFVPFTLPGESVLIEREGERGRLVSIIEPSLERIEPFCTHHGRCGGCAVQHWSYEAYSRWKRGLVEQALRNRKIAAEVEPLVDAGGDGRRRVMLHIRYHKGRAQAGFMEPRSHRLIDLDQCPILVPALADAAEIGRAIGQVFAGVARTLDVQLTATDRGLDCHVRGLKDLSLDHRMDLAQLAERFDLARITFGRELVAERRAPVIAMGPALVKIPPGGFLQATAQGEAIISNCVAEMVGDAAAIGDLFCGVGPFTLRLATRAKVHAVDADGPGIESLTKAARQAQGLKQITTECRDLFKRPLLADELARFDALVFDPPRAGAEAQARLLAAASVPTIVAVSCDPATFARDAAILIEGGYVLTRVVPVDQFKWSGHVETIASFERRG